jgi:ankyrin repeat protein
MIRLVASCSAALLLAASTLGAAGSEVADAVMRGDVPAVRALVEQRADVNARQADGATALHWAVYRADLALTDLLLGAGANPKVANSEGFTPLALAALNGSAPLIESLLKAGADPNERLPRGETPLMMASRTGSVAAMQALLDRGAQLDAQETLRGTTALMWAADQGHHAAVKLLIDRGANLNLRSNPAPNPRRGPPGKSVDPRRSNRALQAAAAGATREEIQRAAERGPRQQQPAGNAQGQPAAAPPRQAAAAVDDDAPAGRQELTGGGLTALTLAARANSLETVKTLLAAGVDINQPTAYGWTPLLVASQNRFYQLGSYLLDNGADPNKANNGAWTPLYLAVDNRNIEGGDYPTRKGDMNHLDFIKKLIAKGADVNAQIKDNTDKRTVFTSMWLNEDGATPFLRAAQSSDLEVMRLLLANGADPKIMTVNSVSALQVAAGIGWVEGLTYEWSEKANEETIKLLLDLGVDPNIQAETGRTALHGAGHKGRTAVIQMLVDHGAKLDVRDYGMTGNDAGGRFAIHTWQPVDYADGLVRVGVQSAVAHPEAGVLFRKLMTERGLEVPPMGRTLASVCITEICDVEEPEQEQ